MCLAATLLLLLLAAPAHAQLAAVRVVDGLTSPVFATSPPGDPRLFIVQQGGEILIWGAGQLLGTPFLDLSDEVSNGFEQGLLGLAFPPDYAASGRFYVHYTDTDGDTVIARFQVSGDPDLADAGSEEILFALEQPFANHNGGHLAFGPNDGFLYASLGDGGSGGDPGDRAQDTGNAFGTILRIDVSSAPGYVVPPSNPGFAVPEIWAYGLRNPYRFSFDRQTGDLFIGDVGQSNIEEVSFQPAASAGGENYGWRCYEGSDPFNTSGCPAPGSLTFPVMEYRHSEITLPFYSVVGGYRYRGPASALQGLYIFADYGGAVFVGSEDSPGVFSFGSVDVATDVGTLDNVAGFGEDADGDVYAVDHDGEVYRFVSPSQTTCPPSPLAGCEEPGRAILKLRDRDADGSGRGDQLTWRWLRGPETLQDDFGDPGFAASYALCLYQGSPATLQAELNVPSGTRWKTLGTRGYKYRDSAKQEDGVQQLLLKAGDAGRARLQLVARDDALPPLGLPLDTGHDVLVQLQSEGASRCWQATFPPGAESRNDAERYSARTP